MEISDAGVYSVAVGAQHSELTLVVKGKVLQECVYVRVYFDRNSLLSLSYLTTVMVHRRKYEDL